jgi:hypothetical protein
MKRILLGGLVLFWVLNFCGLQCLAESNTAQVRAVRGKGGAHYIIGKDKAEIIVGSKLSPGGSIETGRDGSIDLFLGENGPVVRVTEKTKLKIERLESEGNGESKRIDTVLGLGKGRILGNVKKHAEGSSYKVTFPGGTMCVSEGEFDLSATGTVHVISGTCIVVYQGDSALAVTVLAGQTANPPAGRSAAVRKF